MKQPKTNPPPPVAETAEAAEPKPAPPTYRPTARPGGSRTIPAPAPKTGAPDTEGVTTDES